MSIITMDSSAAAAAAAAINELPFRTLYTIIPVLALWILLWSVTTQRIRQKGLMRRADALLNGYNAGAATVFLTVAVFAVDIGHGVLAERIGLKINPGFIGYLYHLFLLQAPMGTILQMLADGNKVNKYTAFVNLFMPLWSYFRIIDRSDGGNDWRLQVIVDCVARVTVILAPRFIADLKLEETAVAMAEELRWYGDLAMFAFWLLFTFRGDRDSEAAVNVFGQPNNEELLARVIGVGIVLYAGHCKREQDKRDVKVDKIVEVEKRERPTAPVTVTATEWRQAKARKLR